MSINILPYDTGVDVFTYKGQKTLQKFGVENAFNHLAQVTDSDPFIKIIEIGTDYAGLTNLLADSSISKYTKTIHTFDINPARFVSYNDKIIFKNCDIFSIEKELSELIQSPGRTLLLCDGGNKKKEFETFHQYLKVNDVIMAHDYAPNDAIFKEKYVNKIWNWKEFEDSYADFPGLEPFLQDIFAEYAWCIRIKK
jgi:hypothetical protein